MNPRIKKIIYAFKARKIDALLVIKDINIKYLTNFPACESWLLITSNKVFYITDFRYILEAKKGLKGVEVKRYTKSIFDTLCEIARDRKVKRIGFDEKHFSLSLYKNLKKRCSPSIRLVAANDMVEDFRVVKDSAEIIKIKNALKVHSRAFNMLKENIKPGISEREIVSKLDNFVKSKGVSYSFDPIIASGINSCYPHAIVTDRIIKNNEPVLTDMGIDVGGYKSDLTRMFFLGKIPPFVSQVNALVYEAQQRAIEKIKAGALTREVDAAARNCLLKNKLAKYFGHGLGHGVGLEIHEAPSLSPKSSTVLKEGMVITVEPAVYIPHKFGIRIEDMVMVTKDGCEVLSDNIH
jgi:Xaa-Pro aminopeptidase